MKKVFIILIGVVFLTALGAGGYLLYHEWSHRFIVDPVLDEEGGIMSHSDNFWMDRSIPVPSP